MSSDFLQREFCLRNDFRSEHGLKQHQSQNKACFEKSQANFAGMSGYQTAHEYMIEFLLMWAIWLISDGMQVEHVKRARKKHRYIMYLFRFSALILATNQN